MSDTPKSYADALEKAFLTPQTAPGSDESLWTKMDLCAQRCLGENRLVQIHPDELRKLISAARQAASPEPPDDFDEAGIRAARPNVSEGGEGETVPADVFNACMVRLGTLEAERDLAIAQRDEARKGYRCYHCKRMFPEDTTHFGKYEELPKCLEHIRSGSGGDCHDAYIRVRRDVWESMTTVSPAVAGAIQRFNKRADELGLNHHVEIPNSAAPDVPRPEEIERLEWYAREPTHKHDALEWYEFIATPDLILRLLSRLRSLPSEPQDGNRKAVEK